MDALPPLPAGAQELPPLPPGAEVMGDGTYSDANPRPLTVTPAGRAPGAARHTGLAAQVGEAIPTALPQPGDEQRDLEFTKSIPVGLAAGAARNVTGAAQWIPGAAGDYATKWDAYLQTLGNPAANEVGHIGGAFLPGGAMLKGARALTGAAKYAPKVVEAAEGLAPAARSLFERAGSFLTGKAGREATAGALAGVGSGAIEPISKADPNAFDETTKVQQPGYSERAGEKAKTAVGRAALGILPQVVMSGARGVKSAADFLTGKGYKTATETLKKDVLGEAEGVIARERGAGVEAESRGSIAGGEAEHNRKIAQQVLDEHAGRSTASKVETGEALQGTALQMREKYHDLRAKNSGYSDMAAKYRDKPVVDTKSVVGKIDETLRRSTDPGVIGFLSRIKDRIASQPKTTFDIADNFRKDLRDAIRTGQVKLESGNTSSVGGETKALKDVHDALRKELAAGVPEFEPVMQKFSELSRPLDPFNKEGGALYGVVTKNGLSDEFKKNPGPVVDKIMKSVRDGDDVLGKLVAENPELKTKIRDHLNEQIFGSAANPKIPSAATINSFNAKNKEVMDQLGLTAEFNGVRDARAAGEKALETANSAEKQVGDLARQKATSEAVAHEYDTLKTVVENATPGEIYGKAESFATKMAKDGHLTKEQHADLLTKIHDAEHRYGQTKSARKWLLGTLGAALTGYGVYSASGPGRFIHSLLPGGH